MPRPPETRGNLEVTWLNLININVHFPFPSSPGDWFIYFLNPEILAPRRLR